MGKALLLSILFTCGLGWASPVGIIEVSRDRGARDIQSASVLVPSEDGKSVTYAICPEPEKYLGSKCAEGKLKTTIPMLYLDNAAIQYLGLYRYRVLRDTVNSGNVSVQTYREYLRNIADQLTPAQAAQVEKDLETGVSDIESARAELNKIQTGDGDYKNYALIFTPLREGQVGDDRVGDNVILSTVHPEASSAALFPFRGWRYANVCACVYQVGSSDRQGRCLLQKGAHPFAWKEAHGIADCMSRDACQTGRWYKGDPEKGKQGDMVGFGRLVEAGCQNYFEARTLPAAVNSASGRDWRQAGRLMGNWQIRSAPRFVQGRNLLEAGTTLTFSSLSPTTGGGFTLDYGFLTTLSIQGIPVSYFFRVPVQCAPADATVGPDRDPQLNQDSVLYSCHGANRRAKVDFQIRVYSQGQGFIHFRVHQIHGSPPSGVKFPFKDGTQWSLTRGEN